MPEREANITRRAFLRSAATIGAALAAGTYLNGCSYSAEPLSPTSTGTPNADSSPGETNTTDGSPSVLLAYFSRPGENYYYGGRIYLETGNTQVVAEMIQAAVPVVVYQIEAADSYSDDYEETVARNVREQNADARPAIANPLPSIEAYDTVLLGSPIWNVRPPMIMRTFLDGIDLAGKQLVPFVTHAMSGLGRTIEDYTALEPAAVIGEGLAIRGEEVRDASDEVEAWLRRIGLLSS